MLLPFPCRPALFCTLLPFADLMGSLQAVVKLAESKGHIPRFRLPTTYSNPWDFRRKITIKGHEIGEDKVASAALLDHGPEHESSSSSEAVVFKVQRTR